MPWTLRRAPQLRTDWHAICHRRCGLFSNWPLICLKSQRRYADIPCCVVRHQQANRQCRSPLPLKSAKPHLLNSTARQQESPQPALDLIGADVASELNELFFAASTEERRLILLNLEVAAPLPVGRVRLARDSAIGRRLEAAALARDREDFVQHLAFSLEIQRVQARRIANDVLGEPIVVAAKAITMPRDVVYRMLLFVNTTVGHSVERVHALAALYDELPIQAAEHMVAIWQALHPRESAKHRPFVWNDEARARARTATVAVRRAPASQRNNERREVS